MDEPVAPLPIDERPPARRRRPNPVALVLALVAAGTALAFLFASDSTDPPSADGATAPTTTVATPTSTAPAPTTADTEPSTVEPIEVATSTSATASVEPARDLPPQATVVVTAEQPFLTRAEAGVGFCAAGVEDACISVATSDHRPGNETNELTLVLPRSFTTWDGDRHDCVLDGPCEVRLWAQDGSVIELSIPVVFAAGDPTPAVDVATSSTTDLAASDVVSISLPAEATVVVLQCVTGLTNGCGTADDFVQQPEGIAELDVTVDRRIFTRRGPFDCATGACELRFILADANHAEPVPLTFDGSSDLGLPLVSVRPTTELMHGTLVELRTPQERSGVAGYSLCAPDELVCAHLGNRSASEELVVRLPRWIEDRVERQVVDCAASRCVIRTLIANEVIDTPVAFIDDAAGPPQTTVVIARGTASQLQPGDDLSLAARGLFVLSDDAVGPTGVDVRFCEEPDASVSQCVFAVGDGPGLQADGSFSTTLTIPNFEFRRSRVSVDGTRSGFCSETCWIVVEPRIDVPGGAVEVDVVGPATAGN